jgi:hypothetical protein
MNPTLNLIVTGALLTALTPILIGALKDFWGGNPLTSALAPFALTLLGWLADALLNGLVPWSPDGLTILVAALTGSLTGAKGRDIAKHGGLLGGGDAPQPPAASTPGP